jgi:predicted phage gp36 major capsid-like protein
MRESALREGPPPFAPFPLSASADSSALRSLEEGREWRRSWLRRWLAEVGGGEEVGGMASRSDWIVGRGFEAWCGREGWD